MKDLDVKFKEGKVELAGTGRGAAESDFDRRQRDGCRRGQGGGGQSAAVDDGTQVYVIKAGDTLSAIAQQFYGDANKYPRAFEANHEVIKDANLIFPGKKIRIPKA